MRRKRRGRLHQGLQWIANRLRRVAEVYFGTVVFTVILALIIGGPGQSLAFVTYARAAPPIFWPVFLVVTVPACIGAVLLVRDFIGGLIEIFQGHERLRKRYLAAVTDEEGEYAVFPLVVEPKHRRRIPDLVFQTLTLQDDANPTPSPPVPCTDAIQLLERTPSRAHVIFSDPGGGKTTLLRHSVLLAAKRLLPESQDQSTAAAKGTGRPAPASDHFLPVYIALRQFAPLLAHDLKEHPDGITTALQEYLKSDDAVQKVPAFAAHLQQLLAQGEILLFLDGLDEVDFEYRETVFKWIASLKLDPASALFIGTRRSGYRRDLLAVRAPAEWEAQPLSERDQHDLAVKLLKVLFKQMKEQDLSPEQAEDETAKLLAALDRHPRGTSWRGNPLLFSLAAYVSVQDDSLPASRVALYARSTEMLLAKTVEQEQEYYQGKGAYPESILSDIRRVLAEVALEFFEDTEHLATTAPAPQSDARKEREQGIFTRKMLEVPRERMRRELNISEERSYRITSWVVYARLIRSLPDGESFEFIHRTFQEYLVAEALARQLVTGDAPRRQETWQFLRAHRFEDAWKQPMRMLAGALIATQSRQGREDARAWLDEALQIVQSSDPFRYQALELAVASLPDIPQIVTLGEEVNAAEILRLWAGVLLQLATHATTEEADLLKNLQGLATDLPRDFVRPALDLLLAALENAGEPKGQAAAARILGGMGDLVDAAPFLHALEQAHDRSVRLAVAQALVTLEHAGHRYPGHEPLRAILEQGDRDSATLVAEALRATGETGRDLIVVALRHPVAFVRRLAVAALDGLGQRAVPELSRVLGDPDHEVAGAALHVLARVGGLTEGRWSDLAPERFASLLQRLEEPVRTTITLQVLEEWGRGMRRRQAQDLAHRVTEQPYAGWRLWQARASLEDELPAVLTALAMMAQQGAEVSEIERTWQDLIPLTLRQLGFEGRWLHGTAVIVPPVCDVPAGAFLMGSDKKKDNQAEGNELPQHTVILGAYQIGTYPLTVAEYACAVQAKAVSEPPKSGGISWQEQLRRLDHPVVCVSWHDALAYASWLASVTGQPWRLPTEAEWEKAARGTDGRIYPWGNRWDKARANTSDGGPQTTAPVGMYAEKGDASPYGAHDLAGNVWEWCSSLYKSYRYTASDGREDHDSTGSRVLRGGSWANLYSWDARAVYRYDNDPDAFNNLVGFRLASGVVGAG